MGLTLREEIKQHKAFGSLEEEAALNLLRTAQLLQDAVELLLRPHGVTPAQYNVLRILRGAGEAGLGRNDIRDRMITRMPDVTRLLDRMEEANLVRRERSESDRRCVPTTLTERGRALLGEIEGPLAEAQFRQFGHLSRGQLHSLVEALTQVRQHLSEP